MVPLTPDELRNLLAAAKPFFDACRKRWAEHMITTAPTEAERRESYYAMICGLNAVENEWRKAANPNPLPDQSAAEPVATGWNGLPIEKE